MKFVYEHQKKLYAKLDLRKGFVTKKELNDANIRKDEVYRLCKSGDLKWFCSGVYKVKSGKIDIEKLIKAIIPDAVFCLRYSLKQYENNEQVEYPEEIRERKRTVYDVAVTWDVSPSKLKQIPGVKINYFRYHKKYKDIGLTTSINSQLPFYDYERTVCDYFCRYKELGLSERSYKEVAYKYNRIATAADKQKLKLYCEQLRLNDEVKARIYKHILNR